VLRAAGVRHVAHGEDDPVRAGAIAAADEDAVAFIGPFRSRDVAEAIEATAPAGLPLLAPVATWAGVTRDDEPGCEDDPADHRGTVLRMVARDTEVAFRLARYLRGRGERALVVAGSGEYGRSSKGSCGWPRCPARTTPTS
jgi:ABC-type branched-subunit amino acid transport system substrate-binding protein